MLTLVVPLFNEEANVEKLIEEFRGSGLLENQLSEVILVNNGSIDNTGEIIKRLGDQHPWVRAVHLKENLNYGGGIYEGLLLAQTPYVGYIPGDLQVSAQDCLAVWREVLKQRELFREKTEKILVKGKRVVRADPFSTRFVSVIYTFLANLILGISVDDINGLPKIFHRSLVTLLPPKRFKTFVFDAQILATAVLNRWLVTEIPVTFHARREGVSSWSGKRIQTFIRSFRQLFELRKIMKLEK